MDKVASLAHRRGNVYAVILVQFDHLHKGGISQAELCRLDCGEKRNTYKTELTDSVKLYRLFMTESYK